MILLILLFLGFISSPILIYENQNQIYKPFEVEVSNDSLEKFATKRHSYTYMGLGDLQAESTLNSLLSWASDNAYYNGFVSMDATWRYYNLLQDSPISPNTDNIDNMFYISSFNNSPHNLPAPIFQARRIGLYSTITNAQTYRMWTYYLEFGNDGNSIVYWLCFYRFTDITDSVSLDDGSPSTLYNSIFFIRDTAVPGSDTLIDVTDYAFYFAPGSTSYDMLCRNVTSDADKSYWQGISTGWVEGYNEGYQTGYTEGLNNQQYNPEMLTIFTGILNIALLPVNVFLEIFNFEVFGINIAGFVSSLLTVSIVVIILRFIFGGKKDD